MVCVFVPILTKTRHGTPTQYQPTHWIVSNLLDRIGRAESVEFGLSTATVKHTSSKKGMLQDIREPELSHPGDEKRGGRAAHHMTSDIAKASALRNAGKQVLVRSARFVFMFSYEMMMKCAF